MDPKKKQKQKVEPPVTPTAPRTPRPKVRQLETLPAHVHQLIPENHDLPTTVFYDHKQDHDSVLMSMDFHPSKQTTLLVGWKDGAIDIWDIAIQKKLCSDNFRIWYPKNSSLKISSYSITRVVWSDTGLYVGVATNDRLVHFYEFSKDGKLTDNLEIVAHEGFVNDLAFCNLSEGLGMVTCGDDHVVVWDLLDGTQLFTFGGFRSPVLSVCLHKKENIEYILLTNDKGVAKDWQYENSTVEEPDEFPPPEFGNKCVTFRYSNDGRRLFSCGVDKVGGHFLREWDEDGRVIKREYLGLLEKSSSLGSVYFDIAQSKILALGEDQRIKFWDMNKSRVFKTITAGGGLSTVPRLKFNKVGDLLAVSSKNGFKILATTNRLKTLKIVDRTSKLCKLVVTLPERSDPASKVARLAYTKSGTSMLVLSSNGIQKLWDWGLSIQNPTGKATASVIPQLWQSDSGSFLANDISDVNLEAAVPWMELSDDDVCVISAAGGCVSIFEIKSSQAIYRFMPHPPATTAMEIYPNKHKIVMVFGMDDSALRFYDFDKEEVMADLIGPHKKRITGLAFSKSLNILFSAGADFRLCKWNLEICKLEKSVTVEHPACNVSETDTHVQYHSNQLCLLVYHESQLSIYDTSKLKCICRWVPDKEGQAGISCAAYSCNSDIVYASFYTGYVGVFDSKHLQLKRLIDLSEYIGCRLPVPLPTVLATHPNKPNQVAVGLTDGSVLVIELSDGKKWDKDAWTPSAVVTDEIPPVVAAPGASHAALVGSISRLRRFLETIPSVQ